MNPHHRLIGLGVLAVLHLGVPVAMIAEREFTLSAGRLYRFQTAPVDPYDAFRGRYVALAIEPRTITDPFALNLQPKQTAYLAIAEGDDGFAKSTGLHATPPDEGDYIQVRIAYRSGSTVHLAYPFDRYYMNETDAPIAEAAYNRRATTNSVRAFVAVRVRNGRSVLEELYLDGVPIAQSLTAPPRDESH